MSREVLGTRPGLEPVVHLTYVEVAEVTAQVMPSILIEYKLVSVEKPVPVNVTISPPYTVPYLGEIDERTGVNVEVYVTVVARL